MKKKIKTYCYQCYNGPDPFTINVDNGFVTSIEPDFTCEDFSPSSGRICVKAYSLVHKMYNPHRIKGPMIRTNPKKGKNEDPKFKEISWDEALNLVAEKLNEIRKKGLLDEEGFPRLAVTMGQAASPAAYQGTFPAFFSSWGPIDFTLGSGQGSKCYHSEHIYGEMWHRGFITASDTPRNKWNLSFGQNTNASAGAAGVWRHAQARERGYKRIQVEPHLSVSAVTSDEWVPIKVKTDAPMMYGMIKTILWEMVWEKVCDLDFLKKRTNSPYLVGTKGYYLRDKETKKPLIWDSLDNCAKVFDDLSIKDYALQGEYTVDGLERGPDSEEYPYENAPAKPSFQLLREHMKEYTPEWAAKICDIPVETIRRLSQEIIENAHQGETIEICGEKLPYRPVAITLGKTINNGPGGYQACWARTILAMLVGGLEVPGGTVGASQRLNRPHHDRWSSVWPGEDGFMQNNFNPTDKRNWPSPPQTRAAYTELVPAVLNTGWSPFLAPTPLAWIWLKKAPENWPRPTYPDVWIIYRANPLISQLYTDELEEISKGFPFTFSIGYTIDETNWFADIILPDHTDLEGLQLFRIGPSVHSEAFWDKYGFALRQPATEPVYNTIDMTDLATELAARTNLLKEYNEAINAGIILSIRLKDKGYNYELETDKKYSREEIWDRLCRTSVRMLTGGEEEHDLAWFKEKGHFSIDYPLIRHFLYPALVKWGLRFEIPYQERLKIAGEELKRRLEEKGVKWWEKQLKEYEPLPECEDFSEEWVKYVRNAGKNADDFPLFLINTRSMQYAWGSNVAIPIMAEVASNVTGFGGLLINAETARQKGIRDGDLIILESPSKKRTCRAIVREGVRPDTVVLTGQFGHWVTPFAKDLDIPNINAFIAPDMDVFDAGGSTCDIVKVRVYKA